MANNSRSSSASVRYEGRALLSHVDLKEQQGSSMDGHTTAGHCMV